MRRDPLIRSRPSLQCSLHPRTQLNSYRMLSGGGAGSRTRVRKCSDTTSTRLTQSFESRCGTPTGRLSATLLSLCLFHGAEHDRHRAACSLAPSRRAQAASSQDVSLGFLGRERECVIVRSSNLLQYLRRQSNRRSSSRIVTTHVETVTPPHTRPVEHKQLRRGVNA